MTASGDGNFEDVMKVDPDPAGLQSLGTQDAHMSTWGGDGRLHAPERGLRTDQPCQHLGLGFQPQLGDSRYLLFKAPGVGHLLWQS